MNKLVLIMIMPKKFMMYTLFFFLLEQFYKNTSLIFAQN